MRQRPTRWTEELDEYLLKKRLSGEPFRLIGSAIGVSHEAVRSRFKRLCVRLGIRFTTRKQAA